MGRETQRDGGAVAQVLLAALRNRESDPAFHGAKIARFYTEYLLTQAICFEATVLSTDSAGGVLVLSEDPFRVIRDAA